MSRVTVPIGPQHPLIKEPLFIKLFLEGEEVIDSMLRLGYVHRGIEKLAESRSYVQNIHLVERVCGICSHVHTTTFCQAVEALLDLHIPPRGIFIRMLLCELERVHSHLLWLGVLAKNMGFETIFMYAWQYREISLNIMEVISGGRVSHAVNIVGGVRVDIPADHLESISSGLKELEEKASALLHFVKNDKSFHVRTKGIAHLSLKQIKDYCVVGPVARASGLDIDIRRDAPYAAYDQLDFKVHIMQEGDVWARTIIRLLEINESVSLCQQILKRMPEGEVAQSAARRVPPGQVVSRCEGPRGEVLYYVQSDRTQNPARVKIRTPSLTNLITLPLQLKGLNMADVSVAISGVDLCIACADR